MTLKQFLEFTFQGPEYFIGMIMLIITLFWVPIGGLLGIIYLIIEHFFKQ